ncbi:MULTISPECIES: LysR family transcriptional regulator [unclassified Vibrio]|uniref:LysR family transcriptional regulator n=1 Tax=unclassified Vibrio TaxID=2614977 RepID=UPI0013615001|nr:MULTISPECIES: LysR family transcriptional regulator [unclassified Vibrio]NAW57414.1 LysR family transcriptional regulator [Vibrio sp. V36_P2S2PM302]NAX21645.1 LysR family transcriptional regulator [Vibrio sp. V39_P1S14PM300]NAX27101.1 LysR family transcriptional regulator [Vibrio sp. V38_P2S17PM301]NAX30232.1 LysR family transcriptional regulator [Vibrio sp. V37_P2S8PM304]
MDRISALKIFVSIVEQGSLSAAAKHLDIERTKVSRHLSELEEWVGTRLLHRTTRTQSLTEAGEQTLERAYQILNLTDDIGAISDRQHNTLSGRLRITCSYSMIDAFLLAAINDFCALWPKVQIELVVADRSIHLVEEGIDLAVRISNDLDPNVIARQIGVCRSVVVAAPEYLSKHGTPDSLQALRAHSCLTFSYFGKSEWHFDKGGNSESVPVTGQLTANISTILLNATLSGGGVSMQPLASVQPYIRSGELVPLLTDWEPRQLGVHLVYSNRRQVTTLLRQFIDFVVERMHREPVWNSA